MTHMSWNMSGNHRTSGDVRRVGSLLLLALVLLVSRSPARADGPSVGPFLFSSSSTRTVKDIEIEAKVRRTLRKDAQLAPLNLGVHMAGGTARLSGPVPSQELKQRAIAIVERVEGVLKVSGRDLYFSTAAQTPKRMSILFPDDPPTQTRSASLPSPTGGKKPRKRGGGADRQITLLAPEMVPRPARVPDAARLTANPHRPTPDISAAVERLRQRDRRFRPIRTRVQGCTVCIFPGDAAGEDAMRFAQIVRRLPGVQHVIIASSPR